MTIEEKAKAYDEALERARVLNNGEDVDIEAGTTTCEYIFPELKESEDEKGEEDEKMFDEIIVDIEVLKEQEKTKYGKELYQQEIDWLKSLKQRNTWKPSDEQLETLKDAIHIKPLENPSDNPLWTLYEQLKKLLEE